MPKPRQMPEHTAIFLHEIGILDERLYRNDIIMPDGARWGVFFRPFGEEKHSEWEVAIHESGHAVGMLSVGQRFKRVELTHEDGVMGGRAGGLQSDNILTLCIHTACGPIATSIMKYGNPITWEECGNDVILIGMIEEQLGLAETQKAIGFAIKMIEGSMKVVEAIAKELVNAKRLRYDQCVKIAEETDPVTRILRYE